MDLKNSVPASKSSLAVGGYGSGVWVSTRVDLRSEWRPEL